MPRTFPTVIVQAINARSTPEVFLVLLDIKHSTFATQRLVNNTENVTSNGNIYTAFPFSIILPESSEGSSPVFTLVLSNIIREFVDEVRSIAGTRERIKIDISIITAGDPDTVLAQWLDFELVSVDYNAENIRATLSVENLLNEPFPGDSFVPSNFPGMF